MYKRLCMHCEKNLVDTDNSDDEEVYIMCTTCGQLRLDQERKQFELYQREQEKAKAAEIERKAVTCDWCTQVIPNGVPNSARRKVCQACYAAIPVISLKK